MNRLYIALKTLGMMAMCMVIFNAVHGTAKADASAIYPNTPADATYYCRPIVSCGAPGTSSPMYLTVGSGEFNNDISFTKVYSVGPTYTVDVIEGTICKTVQNDGYQSSQSIDIVNTAFSMDIKFWNKDQSAIVASDNIGSNCASRNVSYTITLPASSFNPLTSRYEGYIETDMINPSAVATNENSFRYQFTGAVGGIGVKNGAGFASLTVSNRNIPSSYVHDVSAEFAPNCTAPQTGNGVISIYDVDRAPSVPTYQGNGSYPELVWIGYSRPRTASGGGGWTAFGFGTLVGGNAGIDTLPFTYNRDLEYRLEVRGLSRPNAFAIQVTGVDVEDFPGTYSCTIPNTAPTGDITLSCTRDAAGFAQINYTVNTSDSDGDSVDISNLVVAGVARTGGTDTVSGSFGGAFNQVGGASATISDGKAASLNIADTGNFTCPPNNPPTGPFSASCSTLGVLPVKRQLNISLNFADPDGGATSVRVSSNGPPYVGLYIVNANGAFTSPVNYPQPALNGVTYRLWFEARDAQSGAWAVVGTVNYFCYPIPAVLTCSITSSASLEPGEQVKPSAVVTSSNHNLSGSIVYNLKTPGGAQVPGSPQNVGGLTFVAAGTPIGTPPFTAITMPSLGAFNQTGTVTIPAPRPVPDDPPSAPCLGPDVSIGIRPYFKVLGGDIMNTDATSQVQGFNKANLIVNYTGPGAVNDSSGRSGSGTQGLVIDAGRVIGVASGVFTGTLLPQPLTFANYSTVAAAIPNTQFGGGFGALTFNLPTQDAAATAWTAGSTSNGSYFHAGDAVYANNAVGAARMTVYITGGNLTINGDIKYSGATSGYRNLASIPHIKFVVRSGGVAGKGNIYIGGAVGQIDAELIAEGSIDTCYNLAANAYNTCSVAAGSKPLVVNGSLTASKVKMGRLVGTLRESRPEDGSRTGACPAPVANGYCNFNNIAEIIQFTPEVYLSNPAEAPPTPTGNRYDSITALPPLF